MLLYFPILASLVAVLFAFFLVWQIKQSAQGEEQAITISKYIQEGAIAFLKRQYQTMALIAVPLFVGLGILLNFKVGFGFLIGAFCSALAGLIGMLVSTRVNVKVTEAAKSGQDKALGLAFSGGSVTGLLVAGLALLATTGFYALTGDLKALLGLGFGASLVSVFARLGGGIYTKAADVGADLVGKVEEGIPEDDPRNPAVIADQVGDNVGDCAGMAADVFETYVVTVVAVMVLGSLIFKSPMAQTLPLYLGAVAVLASVVGVFIMKLVKSDNTVSSLVKVLTGVMMITALGWLALVRKVAPQLNASWIQIYIPALTGLVIGGGLFLITNYYTSTKYNPVRSIASASEQGTATNIITGLAVGMKSTLGPLVLVALGILISFNFLGLYGLGIAVVAMVSLAGTIVSLDTYGPITDNAAGIAEMSDLPQKVRKVTEPLDAVGNTTKATTKVYAIASAALAALVLFSAYIQEIQQAGGHEISFYLSNYKVLIGLLIGGLLPYLFASYAMEAVGEAGAKVITEVRRQFEEVKGLRQGETEPEYGKTVDIVTKAALKEMIIPALLPVVVPVVIGFWLGPQALGGLLIGTIVTGFFVAVSMTSGGAAWDNAKKFIEDGNLGGKGSSAHQAAVIGDTVGDPYKDTAGPAINPMIKVVNVIALLIAGLII